MSRNSEYPPVGGGIRNMQDHEIEASLDRAVRQLRGTGGKREEAAHLWEQPVEPAAEDAWFLRDAPSGGSEKTADGTVQTDPAQAPRLEDAGAEGRRNAGGTRGQRNAGRKRRLSLAGAGPVILAAAAACLMLFMLSWYQYGVRTDAIVCLDVNPSVTMEINRMNRVLRIKAENADAEAVLRDLSLEGKSVSKAAEQMLIAMSRQEYLTLDDDVMLLSVDCGSSARRSKLLDSLRTDLGLCLEALTGRGALYSQAISIDEALREAAAMYSCSPGKAALLVKLANVCPDLDLSRLSISEIVRRLYERGIDLGDYADYTGDPVEERLRQDEARRAQEEEAQRAAQSGTEDSGGGTGGSEDASAEKDADRAAKDRSGSQKKEEEEKRQDARPADSAAGADAGRDDEEIEDRDEDDDFDDDLDEDDDRDEDRDEDEDRDAGRDEDEDEDEDDDRDSDRDEDDDRGSGRDEDEDEDRDSDRDEDEDEDRDEDEEEDRSSDRDEDEDEDRDEDRDEDEDEDD